MGRLGQAPDESPVALVARQVAALAVTAFEQRLQVVEDQQAAACLQARHELGDTLLQRDGEGGGRGLGEEGDAVGDQLLAGGGVAHRAPEHRLELLRQALTEVGGQHTLADAAHAQQRHQAAALLEDPLGQFGHFHLAAGEVTHVEGSHPVHAWGGCRLLSRVGNRHLGRWGKLNRRRRSLPHSSSPTGLFDRRWWGRGLGQHGREPGLIEEHPLMGHFPQGADLLFLPPWRKDVLLHTHRNKVLEMLLFGIVAASLPLGDRASRDSKQIGQAGLRQADAGAQRQHRLPKGIVTLTIGVPRHRRPLCLPRDPPAPGQQCEAIWKQHVTLWRLTSPSTPTILRGVGRSPGDCVTPEAGPRSVEGLGNGVTLQTLLCNVILVV